MKYPAIDTKKLSGTEPILSEKGQVVSDLNGFWSWAYSNVIDNAERGALAEYLVACALGVNENVRVNWDKYDLLSPEGIASELGPGKVIFFGIWNSTYLWLGQFF